MKITIRIGLIVLGIVVLLAVIGVVQVKRPFPDTNTTLTLPGLQDEVNVYRDENGIPHIYAQNEHDLFLAQGYVHAQDRFWQMEFGRHVSQGRIAEMVGEDGVGNDEYIRTLGWPRVAKASLAYYENESPEMMAILEAYSEGVNTYITEQGDNISLNYSLIGLVNDKWEIEPWQPLHSIGWIVVMAADLSDSWGSEVERTLRIQEMGAENLNSLMPGYPYDSRPVIVPSEGLAIESTILQTTSMPQLDWSTVNTNIVGSYPDNGFFGNGNYVGSNNWVISGAHTDTGLPLIANDPHLGVQMPSIWYQGGLHAPGYNVNGFGMAGIPGVVIGHNENIGWAITNSMVDVQDLYIEKVNPDNPNQVEFMGAWEDMEIIEEVIKVNGGDDVTIEVKISRHGPIITELDSVMTDVLALRWTAFESIRTLESIIGLNKAADYDDFREALRYWDAPSQNLVYADVQGNIAYQLPGLIPIRAQGNGQQPVPGWTGENEWKGWIPYEALPALLNPEAGYIVTANNAIVDKAYPYSIPAYWDSGDRAQRIFAMIEAEIGGDGKLSQTDMARIQFDSHPLLADSYVPILNTLTSNDAQVQAALDQLRLWDRQVRRDSVPGALFELFMVNLFKHTLNDELGEGNFYMASEPSLFHQLATDENAVLWDDVSTEVTETQDDILLAAMTETVAWFEQTLGSDMDKWTWGSIHTVTYVNSPLGESGIGPVEALVNRGPFPADGGESTINAAGWNWWEPAGVQGFASMRLLMDMSDFDANEWIMASGQSGHPFHPNYDDQIALWLNGDYLPMVWREWSVMKTAVNHLILQPEE